MWLLQKYQAVLKLADDDQSDRFGFMEFISYICNEEA